MMNIEEEVRLSAHLLDHDYFHPVVYKNNPNEYEEIEVLENERIPADEEVRVGISRSERVIATHIIAQNVQRLNEQQDLLLFLWSTGHRNDEYVQREIGPYAQPWRSRYTLILSIFMYYI
ncbi:hypothetical protein ACI65C_004732 [Semiaphis heraclei]